MMPMGAGGSAFGSPGILSGGPSGSGGTNGGGGGSGGGGGGGRK
jgi:hypothetical protein